MNNKEHVIMGNESILSMSESALRSQAQQTPDDPIALTNLGSYLSCQGNLVEAELLFERAWRIEPANARIGYNLAIVLMKKVDFMGALGILMELKSPIDLEPNVKLQVGTCLLALHRYQEAVSYLSQASEQLQTNKEAYYNLFKAASRSNNHALAATAKSDYLKVVEAEEIQR
jgi:tetratricopeptide (TPR) repeat protein